MYGAGGKKKRLVERRLYAPLPRTLLAVLTTGGSHTWCYPGTAARFLSACPMGLEREGHPKDRWGGCDRLAPPREAPRSPQGFTGRQSATALQSQQLSPTPQELCHGLDEPCCASDPLCRAAGRHRAAGHGPSLPAGTRERLHSRADELHT